MFTHSTWGSTFPSLHKPRFTVSFSGSNFFLKCQDLHLIPTPETAVLRKPGLLLDLRPMASLTVSLTSSTSFHSDEN